MKPTITRAEAEAQIELAHAIERYWNKRVPTSAGTDLFDASHNVVHLIGCYIDEHTMMHNVAND